MALPQRLVEQSRRFDAGDEAPAEPRNAASVLLLRSGDSESAGDSSDAGPEVYLMRRQKTMAAFGGMWVFPGGSVDPSDDDPALRWAGPTPQEWAEALGVDESLARSLVCAAVRETFEESGVLLAGPDATSVVADTTGDDWEADRVALEAHELSFHDFLLRRGLVLRSDLLGPLSGWLTPIFEPRRFRTWFFVALLPEGQVTRDISSESSAVEWRTAASAVREALAGNVMMMPPTFQNCLEVAQHATAHEVLTATADRRIEMFMPEVAEAGDGEFALTQHPQWEALMRSSGLASS
ncbi:NUDIX hydrolase [Nocardioides gilvus]|uniref:NUDIX hydrolase n=1 Tax=Nocardioides gilvus TaxID=1735589 RepID=UPI001951AE34|nr:NUDIX hydrolase [Nocardioides gilvus]